MAQEIEGAGYVRRLGRSSVFVMTKFLRDFVPSHFFPEDPRQREERIKNCL